jgi:dihydrofolate synthase/folylpolyglutamate synthase
VGLVGRLDATNLWDCDCAIITSIALDHQEYLGDTRDAIAREKVAIGRKDTPLIVGDVNPPSAIEEIAQQTQMRLQYINMNKLPESNLTGEHQRRNAACALMAIDALQQQFVVTPASIDAGLKSVQLRGRFEQVVIDGQLTILDVAHNPAAAETVADALTAGYPNHRVYAVFSALKDKDLVGIVSKLAPAVSGWYCAELSVPRAAPLDIITQTLEQCQSAPVTACASIPDAWKTAVQQLQQHKARAQDQPALVLVAGSFATLSDLHDATADLSNSTEPVVGS